MYIERNVYEVFVDFKKAKFNELLLDKNFIKFVAAKGQDFLGALYFNNKFLFIEALIEHGISFNMQAFIQVLGKASKLEILAHIKTIAPYIPLYYYQELSGMVSLYEIPINLKTQQDCLTPSEILCLHSASNSRKVLDFVCQAFGSLYANGTRAVKDTLIISATYVLERNTSCFIFPSTNRDAILDASTIGKDLIYMPISKFSDEEIGRMIHELTHFSAERMFNNEMKPYYETDKAAYNAFQLAAKSSVISSLKLANISVTKADETKQNPDITLSDLSQSLLKEKILPIYTIQSRLEDPVRVNFLAYHFFGAALAPHVQKEFLSKLFAAEIHNKNIAADGLILLERLGDMITYPLEEQDKELIARLPELQARNISSSVLSYLEPLNQFWQKHITPKVSTLPNYDSLCFDSQIEINLAGETINT